MGRWISLTLLILLTFLQFKLWVSGGMRDVWRLEKAVAEQRAKNSAQAERNAELAAEVADLKEGADAVEERARSELGMVKQDETFYQVIDGKVIVKPGVQHEPTDTGTQRAAGLTVSQAQLVPVSH